MDHKNLMEQANAHTIAVSEAMRNVELAKEVFDQANDSSMSVALLTDSTGITSIDDIIGEDMVELKALATGFVKLAYESRVNELEKLIGVRKIGTTKSDIDKLVCQSAQNTSQDVSEDEITSETEKVEEVDAKEEIELKNENTRSVEPESDPNKKPSLDCSKDNLYKLYITDGMTVKEIVAIYDISTANLYKKLGEFGLVDLKKTMRQDAKYTPSKAQVKVTDDELERVAREILGV